ncbi:MAG: hypothetical protein A3I02_02740 [Betaproteobacteria bacterium RIFCSPLOWO2_02_FULL_67_26]|nr:MAG: hypothetical protein A3I02_02740 [Betaproteobacteria bacterium RIFCSPLOWO2_02_FULL_67_26]
MRATRAAAIRALLEFFSISAYAGKQFDLALAHGLPRVWVRCNNARKNKRESLLLRAGSDYNDALPRN